LTTVDVDELLRLLALGLECLAERLAAVDRPAPPLLNPTRHALLAVLARLEPSCAAGPGDLWHGADMCSMPLLLDYGQVAARLNVSRSTVERAVRDGRLPVVHLGRSTRVVPEELERFVAALTATKETT
jgi:excisionase family DNA binding protein